jgi:hypothetical protein
MIILYIILGWLFLFWLAGIADEVRCGVSVRGAIICSIFKHKYHVSNTQTYGAAYCTRCGKTSHT